jgi:hypothetical protein
MWVKYLEFDTGKLCWRYPEDKKQRTIESIRSVISTSEIGLLAMQKLMGRLNDLALMCPFLKTFKAHLNAKLSRLQAFPASKVSLDAQCISDLYVWAGFLLDPNPWIPICPRPCAPPLSYVSFTSDAAVSTLAQNCPQKLAAAALVSRFLVKFVSPPNSSGQRS